MVSFLGLFAVWEGAGANILPDEGQFEIYVIV